MSKSEQLEKLYPEYFKSKITEKDLLKKCLSILGNIENRYNILCNTNITRKQISEIEAVLSASKGL